MNFDALSFDSTKDNSSPCVLYYLVQRIRDCPASVLYYQPAVRVVQPGAVSGTNSMKFYSKYIPYRTVSGEN